MQIKRRRYLTLYMLIISLSFMVRDFDVRLDATRVWKIIHDDALPIVYFVNVSKISLPILIVSCDKAYTGRYEYMYLRSVSYMVDLGL